MSFTIQTLANELGIDVAILKPEAVSKWNGYLSEADTKYQTATKAQKDALDALENAKREQAAIDEEIKKFGVTEITINELRASNAALSAAMEELKKQGFNVNLPPSPKPPEAVDPSKALQDKMSQGFSMFGQALKVQNEYQSIFEKPFSGDIEALAHEAQQNRTGLYDYAAKKFNFSGERETRQKAAQAKHDAAIAEAAVNKYKEDNPVRTPIEQRGMASKHPQIYKPRDAASDKTFRNLPVKERLAQSVARARASLDNSAA